MALKKCKECDNEVDAKADKCPNCGAPVKKHIGRGGWIGIIILGLIFLFCFLGVIGNLIEEDTGTKKSKAPSIPVSRTPRKSQAEKVYKMGETVSIGYTSYVIWRAWWSNKLSNNSFLDDRPNASFLFIKLSVRNDNKKPRIVPPFKLIDENGAEYETSSKAWAVEGGIGVLESLNPGVQKRGVIVFDIPETHRYKLRVSGGYWSAADALIEIVPK